MSHWKTVCSTILAPFLEGPPNTSGSRSQWWMHRRCKSRADIFRPFFGHFFIFFPLFKVFLSVPQPFSPFTPFKKTFMFLFVFSTCFCSPLHPVRFLPGCFSRSKSVLNKRHHLSRPVALLIPALPTLLPSSWCRGHWWRSLFAANPVTWQLFAFMWSFSIISTWNPEANPFLVAVSVGWWFPNLYHGKNGLEITKHPSIKNCLEMEFQVGEIESPTTNQSWISGFSFCCRWYICQIRSQVRPLAKSVQNRRSERCAANGQKTISPWRISNPKTSTSTMFFACSKILHLFFFWMISLINLLFCFNLLCYCYSYTHLLITTILLLCYCVN